MIKRILTFSLLAIGSFLIFSYVQSPKVAALSGSEFKAGRIIDDEIFYRSGDMSVSSIQAFLNSKVPTCDSQGAKIYSGTTTRKQYAASRGVSTPFVCLKSYRVDTPAKNDVSGYCQPIAAHTNWPAANIIAGVSKSCGISTKVLLVLLQKEQSLITDDWPWPIQYRSATGYACPDTAPCDSQYYGFFNQVYNAARQYKRYKAEPDNFNYRAKANNWIQYHPNAGCGSTKVYIENQATAGLYNYTPYRPNGAALSNLYGEGNSCSSYGNRNFWRMYSDWFGSPIVIYNVVPQVYDNTTDTSGEYAKIGFKLTSKPSSTVAFLVKYDTSHVSSAEYRITIKPENWNSPEKNVVLLKGKDDGINGNTTFDLTTGKLSSEDKRFDMLSATLTPDIPILHQNLSDQVYRLYNPTLNAHQYTGSIDERDDLVAEGWNNEGTAFYGCEAGNIALAKVKKDNNYKLLPYGSSDYIAHINNGFEFQSLVTSTSSQANKTLYVKYRPSTASMFYTLTETSGDSAGFVEIDTIKVCDSTITPVFRLYSSSAGNHFYTRSTSERNSARDRNGYVYEGVAFYLTNGGDTPVYRLFSGKQGNHFYTASENERDSVESKGFRYEGVAFNANSADGADIYRLFSGQQGDHFYTTSVTEKNSAVNQGYRYEGVGFQAY